MTGAEAFSLMRRGANSLPLRFYKNVYSIMFDDKMKVGSGFFSENEDVVKIGIKEFAEHPNDEFSDYKVTEGIVSLFHEVCGHGLQNIVEFRKTTDTSRVLARSDYACNASEKYYGYVYDPVTIDGVNYVRQRMTKQYFDHPHELAAEYAGIKMGYSFLSSVYDKEKANEMICGYVNERVKQD